MSLFIRQTASFFNALLYLLLTPFCIIFKRTCVSAFNAHLPSELTQLTHQLCQFLTLHNNYRGKQWFWVDRELVSAEEFRAQFPVERQAKDISWSDESIRVGVTYAAWTLAEKAEIFGDLVEIFGEQDARILLALAIYKLDGGGAMMNFEDWVAQVWLPEVEPVDGRRLSELFARLSVTKMENYFKRRYDRAVRRSAEGVTLSFDSTSISTYSGTIEDAAWGHAKQNPELRQVNLMVVCDHETGDIVFTHVYDGSINDRGILSTIYLRMQAAGLSLKNNVLVTDRGFQSIYNTQLALNCNAPVRVATYSEQE